MLKYYRAHYCRGGSLDLTQISIFEILGPIMVGPSSSHTAGAVRIGLAARKILGEVPKKANIYFHGSFATTYWGHRTDIAIIAGLLGMEVDDPSIPNAKHLACQQGLVFDFHSIDLGEYHPNSVKLILEGSENRVEIIGSSIGGGRIKISSLDGFDIDCDGSYSVLIVKHRDEPGIIAEITEALATHRVNIAFLEVSRKQRGSTALLVAQTDNPITEKIVATVKELYGVLQVRSFPSFF